MLESILFKLLVAGIIGAAVVLARWIHKDATSELQNMERQKLESKVKGEELDGVYEMAPPQAPWLDSQSALPEAEGNESPDDVAGKHA